MITNQADLKALIRRARTTDAVALDTEFVWERTYYPRLGLIQLALSNEECFLIDPCAIDDLSPIGVLLGDPNTIKILHDAPQDLTILYQATGAVPQNIFDTRMAAGFAGLSSTISLGNLISGLLDIELAKTETRTNWLRRPLHAKQVEYAMDDVRYLRAVRILLLARVLHPRVKNWLQQELARYDNEILYQPIPDEHRYQKIKGAGNLKRKALAILKSLAAWREQEARHRNRPRGHIITDQALLWLSTKPIDNITDLESCSLLSPRDIEQHGKHLVELITEEQDRPESSCPPSLSQSRLSKKEQETLIQLQEYITLKSDVHGLDPALVSNTAELRALIQSRTQPEKEKPARLLSGWRKDFLAEML